MRHPKSYWDDNENLFREINATFADVIEKKSFPTLVMIQKELSGSLRAVYKLGMHRLAEMMGHKPKRRPNGYWNNNDNLFKEINKVFADVLAKKSFPTLAMIERRLPGACTAVARVGGIRCLAELMGYKHSQYITTSDGHFVQSSNEYLVDEYFHKRGIHHEVAGKIASDLNYRYDFKVSNYYVEIWGYSRKDRGPRGSQYNSRRTKKELLYKELELQLISLEKELFDKPTEQVFKKLDDIFVPLGLTTNCRTIVGVSHLRKWNDDLLTKELAKISEQLGQFPTENKLTKMKRYDVLNAITRNGGIEKFRTLLGAWRKRKPKNYWTDEVITRELKNICEQKTRFPQWYELYENGHGPLAQAVTAHGGIDKFRKILGQPPSRKLWTEERILKTLQNIKSPDLVPYKNLPAKLYRTIKKNGGYGKFKKLFDGDNFYYPRGQWTDERIMQSLSLIRSTGGELPRLNNLPPNLRGAVKSHGGYIKFKRSLANTTPLPAGAAMLPHVASCG